MPWIPYTYDNYINIGIAIAWAVGFVVWGLRARRRGRPITSYARAMAFTVIGAVACLILYGGYILARQDYEYGQAAQCQQNLRALSIGLLEYANDHKNHLPPANAWATDIESYIAGGDRSQIFHCPETRSPYSYAFNSALGSISIDKIGAPSNTVMLFECDANTINATGSAPDLVRFRHVGKSYVSFADGRVQGVNSGTAPALNWKP